MSRLLTALHPGLSYLPSFFTFESYVRWPVRGLAKAEGAERDGFFDCIATFVDCLIF